MKPNDPTSYRTALAAIAVVLGFAALNFAARDLFGHHIHGSVRFFVDFGGASLSWLSLFQPSILGLPFAGLWWGVLAAQIFCVALYVACSCQSPGPRLLCGWLAGLALFGGWLAGVIREDTLHSLPEELYFARLSLRIYVFAFIVVLCTMTFTLWLLATRLNLRLQRQTAEQAADETIRVRWSILDLLWFTTIIGATVAICRNLPVTFDSRDRIGISSHDQVVRAVFAVIVAFVGLNVVLHLFMPANSRHTTRRPRSFVWLLALQLPLFGLSLLMPTWEDTMLIVALIFAFNSFVATMTLLLMLLHALGWQLTLQRTIWPLRRGLQKVEPLA
ncbi:hypothetical protein [Anatilimnocola floriformis]|uniref:hypothetical protein n=1 Tax=Anatilimnocola floriformis TaxID=2948575 RepID=UPI0020C1E3A8|nr:hypothetical protein [Anatilimnocola floriformis]